MPGGAIQRPLDVLAQRWGINEVEQVEAANNVVVFPEGAFGLVFAGMRAEFADNDTLRGFFQG